MEYMLWIRKAFNYPTKSDFPIIKGNDVIAQAKSGMRKTTAFVIGTLQLIDPEQNEIQYLVLSPTRE